MKSWVGLTTPPALRRLPKRFQRVSFHPDDLPTGLGRVGGRCWRFGVTRTLSRGGDRRDDGGRRTRKWVAQGILPVVGPVFRPLSFPHPTGQEEARDPSRKPRHSDAPPLRLTVSRPCPGTRSGYQPSALLWRDIPCPVSSAQESRSAVLALPGVGFLESWRGWKGPKSS